MGHKFAELMFTDGVKRLQEAQGSRASYARMEAAPNDVNDRIGPDEARFIAARDSFYIASVGETSWPYVQHRGGPEGFVRVLDEKTLGFADFKGNKQYISTGNLLADDRVSLFFMDYANRARLKLIGRVRFVGLEDEEMLARLAVPGYRARVERGVLVTVEAFDWNCPQHITERFTLAQIQPVIGKLQARIAELEAEVQRLRVPA